MAKKDKTQKKSAGDWAITLGKWTFFICAFVLVIITVLANMGGDGENLKNALEEYVQDATGYYTEIETLRDMSFFPDISFDFVGARLKKTPDDPNVVGRIEQASMSMGFLDVFRKTGRVGNIEVQKLSLDAGVLFPRRVQADRVFIEESGGDNARLIADGALGETSFMAEMGMKIHGTRFNPKYSFPDLREFSLTLGQAGIGGVLDTARAQPVIKDVYLDHNGLRVIDGNLALYKASSAHVAMKTAWDFLEYGSRLQADLDVFFTERPVRATGRLYAPRLNPLDFSEGSRALKTITYIQDVTGMEDIPLVSALFSRLASEEQRQECKGWDIEMAGGEITMLTALENPDCPAQE